MNPISRSGIREDITRPSLHAKYFYDKKHFGDEIIDDKDDDDYDVEYVNENHDNGTNDGEESPKKRKKILKCEICHSQIERSKSGSNENFRNEMSSNIYDFKLCQHCERYYTIQSGSDCDLSGNVSCHSTMSCYLVSSNNLCEKNRKNLNTTHQNCEMQSLTNHKQTSHHCLREFSETEQAHQTDLCNGLNKAHLNTDNTKKSDSNYYDQFNKNDNESILTKMRIRSEVIGIYSRRPIQCPRLDCAVNVAFSALTNHFLFDHPEVPILDVEPDDKNTLVINFASLLCNSSCCLAVLLVSNKFTGPESNMSNGNQIHPKHRDRLPLPVLAARLHYVVNDTIHDDVNSRDKSSGNGDIIIAWISGLDITYVGDLRCTIQAMDNLGCNSIRSLSYRGPINSLRSAQCPKEVFLTGDCLILHEGMLKHLTTDSSTVNINRTCKEVLYINSEIDVTVSKV
ncbi:hypothetical protein PV327_008886 [Microctonus hyperodae]|uniref:DUF4729 domain-containing protein n=1 Tax=Microctonus hyperodae TaxID=165561 RepID=A0AA39KVG9_MICHY|nr:hypothetical protein PV327_008886 [Microctonus hyperodae]